MSFREAVLYTLWIFTCVMSADNSTGRLSMIQNLSLTITYSFIVRPINVPPLSSWLLFTFKYFIHPSPFFILYVYLFSPFLRPFYPFHSLPFSILLSLFSHTICTFCIITLSFIEFVRLPSSIISSIFLLSTFFILSFFSPSSCLPLLYVKKLCKYRCLFDYQVYMYFVAKHDPVF